MMKIYKEIAILRSLLNLTQEELAKELNVPYETINRWENNKNDVEIRNVELVYNYAITKSMYFNQYTEQFLKEDYQNKDNIVLFHGTKEIIEFPLNFAYSKKNNDFGIGFYLGETYKQAATYVSNNKTSFVYAFNINTKHLKIINFDLNLEWMLAIAYYRGYLNKYKDSPIILKIVEKINNADIVIAPIADNRMFDTINEFVNQEITDIQAKHSLSATNLGKQYVMVSKKALDLLKHIQTLYISKAEKEILQKERNSYQSINLDKAKISKIKYRGKGLYIDEILK